MRREHLLFCLPLLAVLCIAASAEQESATRPDRQDPMIGRRITNFVLPDAAGKQVGLADFKDNRLVVVVFMGTQCPISNAYVPVLNELQQQYGNKRLQVLGVNANPSDSPEAIARHIAEFQVGFPVLVDTEQSAECLFEATRTCECFLLDGRREVRYHGRIDDRFGYDYKRDKPRRSDLREAIDELLDDKPVSVSSTDVAGCRITPRQRRLANEQITYTKHVAPILQKHCVDCHRPGTAAPFSLIESEDAADWSEMIREVVIQRRMPPWHADPRYGHFKNERRIPQDEIDTLVSWIDNGTPLSDEETTDKVAESAKHGDRLNGWRIGEPDIVFRMPEPFTVPAKGEVKYQYFTTKTDFDKDVWIQAAECRPGNRAVVHHIIVFYREEGSGREKSWIAATAPGADPMILAEGFGRKIPAGAELVWQMHYTTTGKEETDCSEIGLVFCKQPPRHEVQTHGIANARFKIPPGAANHEVVSEVPAIRDTVVLSLFPHMHLRGKDFQYEAVFPDGRREVLLSVPQYDFNWQHTYRLQNPLRLPKGGKIRCVAHFDNSAANPANPDPAAEVRWGDQTWEEMMIGYIDFYWDDSPENVTD